jgi:Fungal Zn(2)-Cys(6) binuclear cluster domain
MVEAKMHDRIKCNRELPCQNCIVRGIHSQCDYRGHAPITTPSLRSVHAEGMQERLNRLENLVTTLVAQDSIPSQANPDSEDGSGRSSQESMSRDVEDTSTAGIQHGLGVLKVDGHSSVYRGSTHWRDVMKEVTCPSVLCIGRNNVTLICSIIS